MQWLKKLLSREREGALFYKMSRMSPRRHHEKEPKHFLLYFPEDRTCSVLPRSKLVDAEGNENLKLKSEVKAKWSERGQKLSIYKGIIVSSDGNQTMEKLKAEWAEFGKHILTNDKNPVETFLKQKEMAQLKVSSGDETDFEAEPESKRAKKRKDSNKGKIIEGKKNKFDSSDPDDEYEETSDTTAKKLLKKWKGKGPKKNVKKQPKRDSDTDEDSDKEKMTALHKKEKKAKRSLIKEYKVEEDSKNREESSKVLEAVRKREPTEETNPFMSHAVLKDIFRGVLAEELKPVQESIGTLTSLYSQLNSHLLYRREKNKTPKQIDVLANKRQTSSSPSIEIVEVQSDKNSPPLKLFEDFPQPGPSGITENVMEKQQKQATVAIESEGDSELEYVGDSSLGIKAHKDLLSKALDSSNDRKKLALNMMEVVFSSSELRESTINGSHSKKKLNGLKVAAIKGFIFMHYPPQDEADRTSSWGKIKEAITDKCRKFRPEKKTYLDDLKH